MAATTVTDATFDEVIGSADKRVLWLELLKAIWIAATPIPEPAP